MFFTNNLSLKIKILFILFGLAQPYHWFWLKWTSLTSPAISLLFLIVFILCVIATILSAFTPNKFIRYLYAFLFASSILIVDTYQAIMGEFFFYSSFVQIYEAILFAGEMFDHFGEHTIQPFISAGFVFVGIIIPPVTDKKAYHRYLLYSISPAILLIILAMSVFVRGGTSAAGMPSSFVTGSYALVFGIETILNRRGNREAVTMVNLSSDKVKNGDIILLVDESVRGNYLDIGGGDVVSELLKLSGEPKANVFNYGIAASAVNCSYGSNLILRYGGTRDSHQVFINNKPSIWAFAHAAGYRTVYLDGQQISNRLHNGMSQEEVRFIDDFIQYDNIKTLNRDQVIAEDIIVRSKNHIPEFIFVNKVGAHFPVQNKYPEEFKVFTPVEESKSENLGSEDNFYTEKIDNWAEYKNAYRNTLLWNVGQFFKTILHNADLENLTIVYTSDHGQNFHENESKGYGLHCSNKPSVDEGIVPMVIISQNANVIKKAEIGVHKSYGQTSHYNIFPTLLHLMNYSPHEIKMNYGNSLFETTDDPLTFNARFRSMIGSKPYWVKINQ